MCSVLSTHCVTPTQKRKLTNFTSAQ
jgi:hypothetical protein